MLSRQAKERQETVDRRGGQQVRQATTERRGAFGVGASSLTEGRVRSSRTDSAGSGGPPDVAMVEATDFANRDDPAEFRPLNWPAVGCILVEREVSARPVVVREVASQGTAQVLFAEDKDMIQTLAPDGADEALREGVLPWAVRRRQDFTDGASQPMAKPLRGAPHRL